MWLYYYIFVYYHTVYIPGFWTLILDCQTDRIQISDTLLEIGIESSARRADFSTANRIVSEVFCTVGNRNQGTRSDFLCIVTCRLVFITSTYTITYLIEPQVLMHELHDDCHGHKLLCHDANKVLCSVAEFIQLSLRRLFDEAVLESTSVHWSLDSEAWELGGMTLTKLQGSYLYNYT